MLPRTNRLQWRTPSWTPTQPWPRRDEPRPPGEPRPRQQSRNKSPRRAWRLGLPQSTQSSITLKLIQITRKKGERKKIWKFPDLFLSSYLISIFFFLFWHPPYKQGMKHLQMVSKLSPFLYCPKLPIFPINSATQLKIHEAFNTFINQPRDTKKEGKWISMKKNVSKILF